VLASAVLAPKECVAISRSKCTNCEYLEPAIDGRLEFVLYERENMPKSTSHWLASLEHETREECPHCFARLRQPIAFKSPPSLLVFGINSRNIKISKTIKFVQGNERVVLDVRGLIYFGGFHCVSHIIGLDGNIWYHGGMTTGHTCKNEGDIGNFSKNLIITEIEEGLEGVSGWISHNNVMLGD
jgi:hypothetical protein